MTDENAPAAEPKTASHDPLYPEKLRQFMNTGWGDTERAGPALGGFPG